MNTITGFEALDYMVMNSCMLSNEAIDCVEQMVAAGYEPTFEEVLKTCQIRENSLLDSDKDRIIEKIDEMRGY